MAIEYYLIFGRCRHSSAARTPVKYENDWKNLRGFFCEIKKFLNEEIKQTEIW